MNHCPVQVEQAIFQSLLLSGQNRRLRALENFGVVSLSHLMVQLQGSLHFGNGAGPIPQTIQDLSCAMSIRPRRIIKTDQFEFLWKSSKCRGRQGILVDLHEGGATWNTHCINQMVKKAEAEDNVASCQNTPTLNFIPLRGIPPFFSSRLEVQLHCLEGIR